MTRGPWRPALIAAASFAAPAAIVRAMVPAGATGPLGPAGLMIGHLVAASPMAWRLAGGRSRRAWPGTILGGAAAGLAAAGAAPLGDWIAATIPSMIALSLLRTTLAVALVAPWLSALPAPSAMAGRLGWAAALAVATLSPLTFADRLIATGTAAVTADLEKGRIARATRGVAVLVALGSDRPILGESPAAAARRLDRALGRLRREAGRDDGPSGSIARGFRLIQLDRLDEAAGVLRPLADRGDVDAMLLLGAIDRDLGRWDDADRVYRAALPRIEAGDVDRRSTAYDGLSEALRESGRGAEAASVYREAAGRLPSRAGYFSLQLGRQELDLGRPAAALAALDEATRLDPRLEPQAVPLRRRIRVATPGCLLSSSRGR